MAEHGWFWEWDRSPVGPFDTRDAADESAVEALCPDAHVSQKRQADLDLVDDYAVVESAEAALASAWERGEPLGSCVQWVDGRPSLTVQARRQIFSAVEKLNAALAATIWTSE
jgi:hypothetical protein